MSKIKIKNSLPHLLAAAMNHEDCPAWLEMKIWNAFNDNSDYSPNDPEYPALMLKNATVAPEVEFREDPAVHN